MFEIFYVNYFQIEVKDTLDSSNAAYSLFCCFVANVNLVIIIRSLSASFNIRKNHTPFRQNDKQKQITIKAFTLASVKSGKTVKYEFCKF